MKNSNIVNYYLASSENVWIIFFVEGFFQIGLIIQKILKDLGIPYSHYSCGPSVNTDAWDEKYQKATMNFLCHFLCVTCLLFIRENKNMHRVISIQNSG